MPTEGTALPAGLRPDARRSQRLTLGVVVLAAILIASLAPLASFVSEGGIATMDMMSDPAEVTGIPWYIGGVNTINLHVWAAALALYVVAGFGLRRRDPRLGNALLWLAAFTLVVLVDDEFLVHEIVLPWLLGMPEEVTFTLYAVTLGLILLFHGRVLLDQREVVVLVLGLGSLALSVGLDLTGWDTTVRRFGEETFKLLGALAWTVFPAALVLRALGVPDPDLDVGPPAT